MKQRLLGRLLATHSDSRSIPASHTLERALLSSVADSEQLLIIWILSFLIQSVVQTVGRLTCLQLKRV